MSALLWIDALTGRRFAESTAGGRLVAVFSPRTPDRRWRSGCAVRLLDAESGEELLVLEGQVGPVKSLAFSSDGRRLAAAVAVPMRDGAILVCRTVGRLSIPRPSARTWLGTRYSLPRLPAELFISALPPGMNSRCPPFEPTG